MAQMRMRQMTTQCKHCAAVVLRLDAQTNHEIKEKVKEQDVKQQV